MQLKNDIGISETTETRNDSKIVKQHYKGHENEKKKNKKLKKEKQKCPFNTKKKSH